MLFKDQAEALVARWENLRDDDDLETLAAQTAIALSRMDEVPAFVLDALDRILEYEYKRLGRAVYDIVRFLRFLSEEQRVAAVKAS